MRTPRDGVGTPCVPPIFCVGWTGMSVTGAGVGAVMSLGNEGQGAAESQRARELGRERMLFLMWVSCSGSRVVDWRICCSR